MQIGNVLEALVASLAAMPQGPVETSAAAVQQRQAEPTASSSTSTSASSSQSTFATSSTSSQASSTSGVVTIFVDQGPTTGLKYNAAVVTGCAAHTVYALRCYTGPYAASSICGPNGPEATITAGPSTYAVTTATSTVTRGANVVLTVAEKCALNPSQAICSYFIYGAAVSGASTVSISTLDSTTLSGSWYNRVPVTVTAGGEKLASLPTECPAPPQFPPAIKPPNAAAGFNMRAVLGSAAAGAAVVIGLLLA